MKSTFNIPAFLWGLIITYLILSLIISGGILVTPIELVSWLGFMAAFWFGVPEIIAIAFGFIWIVGISALGWYTLQKLVVKLLNK